MLKMCSTCKKYLSYPGYDYCCKTCRDSYGSSHGPLCKKILNTVSKVCLACNTYLTSGYDYCCKTCRDSYGSTHGLSCKKLLNTTSKVCSACNTYLTSGYDYCCKTCRDTQGVAHGHSCKKITNSALPTFSSKKTNCNNLKTGLPLYGPNTICFYKRSEPYYEFTNFYVAPITIDGKLYNTTEHYFQSLKFTDIYISEQIRLSATPREAFNIAQLNKGRARGDWHNGFKDAVMLKALRAKFTQHPKLKALLLSTGTNKLVEHTVLDKEWGDNGDGTGNNKLGLYLEQIRNELSN